MRETKNYKGKRLALIGVAMCASISGLAWGDNLPSMGEESSPWNVDVTYENHTVRRERAGLAKFRNTLQVEADKRVGDGWQVHSITRGTFDGVYRMNSDEYGKDAGGAIQLQNLASTAAPDPSAPPVGTLGQQLQFVGGLIGSPNTLANPTVPHGGGVNGPLANALFAPNTTSFGFNSTNPNAPNYNPNSGMRVLGDRWHATEGGVAFGVPVRPCDADKRGCRDFGGYGNLKQSELEAPEFNDRLDFIRELYAKKTFKLDSGKDIFLKVGKQQVVWGRTDLFRVLDVINPVDYSRNNIYDELSDIRIPMWIAQAEYRMGASESMQDRNFQIVWNFDKFRPNNLGQCGTANVILDAGCFFRGMANLWDNGGTVANFAAGGVAATDFGPNQIGIRKVHLPEWSLENTQLLIRPDEV